ncbi:hypothetical protein GA830_01485 [Mesorhizobium sp. NBSH29]|uniref:hypothetical protein n=1 Tax=Mesorhizobium sp. NBSH29 TaxID=2654249 RepID=UPI0018963EF5|nr:hypothetical protein [Mesorhizobium sp. NBSH29]QPC85559.1 hypothetical protein GA830_01485 [Mesorhizobium sp. NBSH29]
MAKSENDHRLGVSLMPSLANDSIVDLLFAVPEGDEEDTVDRAIAQLVQSKLAQRMRAELDGHEQAA